MEQEKPGGRKKWLALISSYKYVLLVAAAGVLCLLWPGGGEAGERAETPVSGVDMAGVEAEMEEILSTIQGVGQLRLMLTLDTGAQRELAGDTSLSYNGAVTAPEDYTRTSQTVVVSGSDGDQVVVTREVCPRYRGALVVCQGAGDAGVRLAVVEAVSALTGLGSDRISVIEGAAP